MGRGRKKQETKPLTPEQEKLVLRNTKLVEPCAFFVGRRSGVSLEERMSIGMLALVEAAARFDPEKGEFKDFARAWIGNSIRGAIRKLRPHLDARKGYTRDEILAGKDKKGRELTISDPHGLLTSPIPLDEIIDPTTTLESKAIKAELKIIAHEVVDQFSPGPRALLEALYFEEITLREYAERVDLAPATIMRHRDEVLAVVLPRLARRLTGT